MSDPLRDPRFPDRPQTQDFWRLSEIALDHDGDPRSVEDIIGEVIDHDSLVYMVHQRVGRLVSNPDLEAILGGVALDAFMLGAKFIQRGGHRPDETGTTPEKGA